MSEPTKTDQNGMTEWKLDDVVVQLREWGSEQTYQLPTAASGEWLIGTARACEVRDDARCEAGDGAAVHQARLRRRVLAIIARSCAPWRYT